MAKPEQQHRVVIFSISCLNEVYGLTALINRPGVAVGGEIDTVVGNGVDVVGAEDKEEDNSYQQCE